MTNICSSCQAALEEAGATVTAPRVAQPLLRYHEPRLVEDLKKLSTTGRALFAAACAERLLPVYRWVHERTRRGDPASLEGALKDLWSRLRGESGADLESQRDLAEMLVPYEDDFWVDECAYAQNAAAAVGYAIESFLTGDAQEAAWVARQAYEALDFWVTTRDNIDLNARRARDRIDADPVIQEELGRQRRDLDQLLRTPDHLLQTIVSPIKENACTEALQFFRTEG